MRVGGGWGRRVVYVVILGLLLDQSDSLEDIRDVVDTPLLYVQGLCSSIEINRTLFGLLDEGYEFLREQAQRAVRRRRSHGGSESADRSGAESGHHHPNRLRQHVQTHLS